jgi:hypothetical protein
VTHDVGDHGHLVVSFNGMEVSQHPITAAGLVIGRSKQCDICISLLGLSRRHTQVEVGGDGVVVIDLGSESGTWVNNVLIEDRRVLRDGDVLNFFDYAVHFSVGSAAYATPVGAAARTVTHPVLAAVFGSIAHALPIRDNDENDDHDWQRARSAADKTINALARKLVGVDTSGWAEQIAAEVCGLGPVDDVLADPAVRTVRVVGVTVSVDRGQGFVDVALFSCPAAVDRACARALGIGPGESFGPTVVGEHTVTVRGASPDRTISASRRVAVVIADDEDAVPPG